MIKVWNFVYCSHNIRFTFSAIQKFESHILMRHFGNSSLLTTYILQVTRRWCICLRRAQQHTGEVTRWLYPMLTSELKSKEIIIRIMSWTCTEHGLNMWTEHGLNSEHVLNMYWIYQYGLTIVWTLYLNDVQWTVWWDFPPLLFSCVNWGVVVNIFIFR